jgi:hypothetical protein
LTESDFAANYTIFYSLQSKGMIFDFWSLFWGDFLVRVVPLVDTRIISFYLISLE